jgi:hypothetical protein
MTITDKTIAHRTEQAAAVYVPFGGNRVDLGEEAQSPVENPLLQYAIGLPATRPKVDAQGYALYDEETGEELVDNINYSGFFTAVGVDKDLDQAMTQLEVPTITIQHRGGPQRHWMLAKVTCFLLAKGIPSNGSSEGRYGLVYQWSKGDAQRRGGTVFYAQVMLRPLLPHYTKPFVFCMRSTQTGDALSAFSRQYRVLNRAHEELQKHGLDMPLPLYAYSLTLKASNKQDIRGQGPVDKRKPIYPMIAIVPDVPDNEYLRRQEMPLEYTDLLREATDNAVEWAKALSGRIASGSEGHETTTGDIDNTPF